MAESFLRTGNGDTKTKKKEDNLVKLIDLLKEVNDNAPNAHLNEVSVLNRNLGKEQTDGEMRTWFSCLKKAQERCKIKLNG